jgi:hypothetical protein
MLPEQVSLTAQAFVMELADSQPLMNTFYSQ